MSKQALPLSTPVAVIGAGAMGAGIAQVAAQAGHPVRLLDNRPGAAEQAVAGIRAQLAKLADKGRLSPEAAQAAGDRLSAAASSAELADADYQTIEAAMIEGHPGFVANNGRLGFNAFDYHAYAPETGSRFAICKATGRRPSPISRGGRG